MAIRAHFGPTPLNFVPRFSFENVGIFTFLFILSAIFQKSRKSFFEQTSTTGTWTDTTDLWGHNIRLYPKVMESILGDLWSHDSHSFYNQYQGGVRKKIRKGMVYFPNQSKLTPTLRFFPFFRFFPPKILTPTHIFSTFCFSQAKFSDTHPNFHRNLAETGRIFGGMSAVDVQLVWKLLLPNFSLHFSMFHSQTWY